MKSPAQNRVKDNSLQVKRLKLADRNRQNIGDGVPVNVENIRASLRNLGKHN